MSRHFAAHTVLHGEFMESIPYKDLAITDASRRLDVHVKDRFGAEKYDLIMIALPTGMADKWIAESLPQVGVKVK